MKRKAKFQVGQLVHVKDWKDVWRVGEVRQVYKQEDGFYYIVHWNVPEGIYQEESDLRPLTKRERGGHVTGR